MQTRLAASGLPVPCTVDVLQASQTYGLDPTPKKRKPRVVSPPCGGGISGVTSLVMRNADLVNQLGISLLTLVV